jgi:hypothetical protein
MDKSAALERPHLLAKQARIAVRRGRPGHAVVHVSILHKAGTRNSLYRRTVPQHRGNEITTPSHWAPTAECNRHVNAHADDIQHGQRERPNESTGTNRQDAAAAMNRPLPVRKLVRISMRCGRRCCSTRMRTSAGCNTMNHFQATAALDHHNPRCSGWGSLSCSVSPTSHRPKYRSWPPNPNPTHSKPHMWHGQAHAWGWGRRLHAPKL